jgi:hypothetical protein
VCSSLLEIGIADEECSANNWEQYVRDARADDAYFLYL